MIYKNCIKKIIDFLMSIIGIIILSPLFTLICFILFFINKGKVFFVQKRPGYKEKPIYIIKFKTMNDKKDIDGELLPNDQRTTRVGMILRKLSLDEIPQLINVIKGDLSLVGPRPLLYKYLPLYSKLQRKRHNVMPGITGWAQVNGRNQISWTKKFEYDIYYVNNISFWFDVKILCLTIFKVFKSEGVNLSKTVTSEPFNGKN